MKKRLKILREVLPKIIAGILWAIAWYYFDNKLFHAFVIAVIWADKQQIAEEVKELKHFV